MKYAPIGKSGLVTSKLTLGTMIFGESSSRSTPKDEALQIIDTYLGEGGNHLDTADVYAKGRSEEIVGEAVKSRRQEVIIATKVRFRTQAHPNGEGLSRQHIIAEVDDSLKRLQTDYIDLLYLHCFDPITPMEESIRALEDLIRSGKVRYIGLSNFKAWQLMKAQGLSYQMGSNPFIAAQYQYSLVKRDLEYEFFDLFQSEGLGLLPWGPLGGGFLTGKYSQEGPKDGRIATTGEGTEESWQRRNTQQNWQIIEQVKAIANKHNASPSQVAIAWILSKPVVPSVILGVRTMEQLKDNMKAIELRLSAEETAALDQVSVLPELYPYRMIADYGVRKL
jgi:aryl-alcohol dehydrogenase-like predicted oxidoreductase